MHYQCVNEVEYAFISIHMQGQENSEVQELDACMKVEKILSGTVVDLTSEQVKLLSSRLGTEEIKMVSSCIYPY